jgi:hypothetical protein
MATINSWWSKYFEIKAISREQKVMKQHRVYKNSVMDAGVMERVFRQFLPEDEQGNSIQDIINARRVKQVNEQLTAKQSKLSLIKKKLDTVKEDIRPEDDDRRARFYQFLDNHMDFIFEIVAYLEEKKMYVSAGIAMDYFNMKNKHANEESTNGRQ